MPVRVFPGRRADFNGPMTLALLLLAVVELGAGFGGAEVDGVELDSGRMEIEITVALAESPGPVIAHLVLGGANTESVALSDRGSGRWGAIVEVRRADWHLVFEDVSTGGLTSEASLTELGLDPALLGSGPATSAPPAPRPDGRYAWVWLVVALVAAASAMAVLGTARASNKPRHLRSRSG